jgi:hypothetical protein
MENNRVKRGALYRWFHSFAGGAKMGGNWVDGTMPCPAKRAKPMALRLTWAPVDNQLKMMTARLVL